jgi:hypothetical protein
MNPIAIAVVGTVALVACIALQTFCIELWRRVLRHGRWALKKLFEDGPLEWEDFVLLMTVVRVVRTLACVPVCGLALLFSMIRWEVWMWVAIALAVSMYLGLSLLLVLRERRSVLRGGHGRF